VLRSNGLKTNINIRIIIVGYQKVTNNHKEAQFQVSLPHRRFNFNLQS